MDKSVSVKTYDNLLQTEDDIENGTENRIENSIECRQVLAGKYRIKEKLGEGGSGKVYRAYDRHLRCDVAIKEFERTDEISEQELALLKELRHGALPRIIDFLQDDRNSYLVMEYIDGRNLEEYIREKGRVPQEQAVRWAVKLAEVLMYLHERDRPVVYRDMKPANIMIDAGGEIRLVDFGTAYLHYHSEEKISRAGTIGYGAPELFSGSYGVDERSDIYGLGATLFHMLTGNHPGLHPAMMQPLRVYDRCFSRTLEKVVAKSTRENKEERYHTVRQFRDALLHCRKAEYGKEILEKAGKAMYYLLLLYCFGCFFHTCSKAGVFDVEWLPGMLWKSKLSFREVVLEKTVYREILKPACNLFLLMAGQEGLARWKEKRGIGMRQGRSLLLTAKKGRGLILTFFGCMLALILLSSEVQASEQNLEVHLKDRSGRKLLLRQEAAYDMEETLLLELPVENFTEGNSYALTLECVDRQTGNKRKKTFLLKRLE